VSNSYPRAGRNRAGSDAATVEMARNIMQSGAAGVFFGRNVFQAKIFRVVATHPCRTQSEYATRKDVTNELAAVDMGSSSCKAVALSTGAAILAAKQLVRARHSQAILGEMPAEKFWNALQSVTRAIQIARLKID